MSEVSIIAFNRLQEVAFYAYGFHSAVSKLTDATTFLLCNKAVYQSGQQ